MKVQATYSTGRAWSVFDWEMVGLGRIMVEDGRTNVEDIRTMVGHGRTN